jgi:hypothetical protein
VAELKTLTVTNSAIDDPANTLSYALVDAPTGAVIDSNGIITWTPTEAQGPSTNTIITVVTDDATPPLSATNSFTVVVTEVNLAPTLPLQPDRTVAEGTLLTVTNTAADNDLPANMLSYVLLNPPAGAVIDTNGIITWTPSEAQGPSTNTIVTVVTDNGFPPLSATNSFTVMVTEVNLAPVLPPQANRTITAQTTLIVTNTATDSDFPANALSYELSNPPTGAVIDQNGIITWTPGTNQGLAATGTITTVVTDFGVPPMSATNSFLVTVRPALTPPIIDSISVSNAIVTLSWTTVSGYTYKLESSENFTGNDWTPVGPSRTAVTNRITATDDVAPSGLRFYRVSAQP